MTTPSGAIALSDVNVELGRPSNQNISMNDSGLRGLAGISSGTIDMNSLRGKSSYKPMAAYGNAGNSGSYSNTSAGTAYAYPSVSVSGGSGGYTYQWSYMNGLTGGTTLNNNGSSNPNVSKTFSRLSNGSFDVYLQCIVTDNTQHSITVTNIEASAYWGNAQ